MRPLLSFHKRWQDSTLVWQVWRHTGVGQQNTETQKIVHSMKEGVLSFLVVGINPDGKTLATGGIDRNVTIWKMSDLLKKPVD